jgi:concanavalin A-like lectin/glucanase superfamily protein
MKEKIKKHLKKRKKIYSLIVGILMILATLFGATAAIEDGRIVNMPFNESIEDISPYNETWSYVVGSSTTYTNDSIEGFAANFSDNVINLNDLEYYGTNTTTAFTFNIYFKMKDVPTSSTNYFFLYITSNNFNSYISYRGSDNRMIAATFAGAWRNIEYYSASGLNQWNMLTYSWDGNNYKLYFNNVSVGSTSSTTSPGSASGRHYINGNHDGSIRLNALFDDYMVWNRAITTDEISELYAEIPPPPPYPTNVTGDGSSGDPFIVNDCKDLQDLTYIMDPVTYEYVELNNTIDCAEFETFEPIANNSFFYGSFQGNGYTIKNIQNDQDIQKGLFYQVDTPTKIQNFTLQNVTFENGDYQGCILGQINDMIHATSYIQNINITDCTINGGNYLGGIAGYIKTYTTTIQSLYLQYLNFDNLNINGSNSIGGVAGKIYLDADSPVTNKPDYLRYIKINANLEGTGNYVGGLVGELASGLRNKPQINNILINLTGYSTGLIGYLDTNNGGPLIFNDIRITGDFLGEGLFDYCFNPGSATMDDVIIYNEANNSFDVLNRIQGTCDITYTDVFYNNASYTDTNNKLQGLSYNDLKLNLPIFENLTGWDLNRCQEHTLTFENYNYPGLGTFSISEPTNTETISYFEGESAIINITLNPTGLMCDCDILINDSLEKYNFDDFDTFSYMTAIEDTYQLDVVCAEEIVNQSISFNTHEIREHLNIVIPDHSQRKNTSNLDMTFNFNTTEPGAFTCRGYINGSQQFTDSYTGNINYTENLVFPLGISNYYVQCDGLGGIIQSQTLQYDFDNATPFIESFAISTFGDSEFINTDTIIFDGRVTDNALYRVNMTIKSASNEVVFNNYSGDLSSTSYIWNHTINFSGQPEENYTVYIEATDQEMIADLGGINPTDLEFIFFYDECVPVWNCTVYERCLINNTQSCSAAFDSNLCGEPLADYSIVDTQNCTYVSSSGGASFPINVDTISALTPDALENIVFSLVGAEFSTGIEFIDNLISKIINPILNNWNSKFFQTQDNFKMFGIYYDIIEISENIKWNGDFLNEKK